MTNWRDLKYGDRVRVTFEAPVSFVCKSNINLTLDPDDYEAETSFTYTEANAATWELLDPPLKVGTAEHLPTKKRCAVLALADGFAWVRYDTCGSYDTQPVNYFRNVSEGA